MDPRFNAGMTGFAPKAANSVNEDLASGETRSCVEGRLLREIAAGLARFVMWDRRIFQTGLD